MKKRIVLLTKSRKHKNYCVAGKDIDSGIWIRLISNNIDIHNAINKSDLVYKDGTEAKVLDVVQVEVGIVDENNIDKYQPENYILNTNYNMTKLGKFNYNYLNRIIENNENIFFNNINSVTEKELDCLEKKYSLMLIEANIVKIRMKNENTFMANIKYKGKWYNNLTITDNEFTNRYYYDVLGSDDGINLYNVKLVVSLGELYNSRRYKLIASIIEPSLQPMASFI